MKRLLIPTLFVVTAFCVVIILGGIWFYLQTTVPDSVVEGTSNTDTIVDTTNGEGAYIPPTYILVHIEPESESIMMESWPYLIDLVELADSYGAKLTLQFSSTWVDFILSEDERSSLVYSWDDNGHEIGLHHHGQSHAAPDGYTNKNGAEDKPWYQGSAEDLYDLVSQLSVDGSLTSASMTDEETDWVEGLLYDSTQLGEKTSVDDLISAPEEVTYGGYTAIRVGKAGFGVTKPIYTATLEEISEELTIAQEGEIMGLVYSDPDIEVFWDETVELFAFFQQEGIVVETLSSILSEFPSENTVATNQDNPSEWRDNKTHFHR